MPLMREPFKEENRTQKESCFHFIAVFIRAMRRHSFIDRSIWHRRLQICLSSQRATNSLREIGIFMTDTSVEVARSTEYTSRGALTHSASKLTPQAPFGVILSKAEKEAHGLPFLLLSICAALAPVVLLRRSIYLSEA